MSRHPPSVISGSDQQALKPPDLPYVSVEVNLIQVNRLFHSQWTRNGMLKNRSAEAFAVKAYFKTHITIA